MSLDRQYPKKFYRGAESRMVSDAYQESQLGDGWTTEQEEAMPRGVQEYPKAITGRNGRTVVVGNPEEEAAEGGGPNLASDAADASAPQTGDKYAPLQGINEDIPEDHKPHSPSGPTIDDIDRVTDPTKTVDGNPVFVSGEPIPDPKGGKDGVSKD